MGKGKTGQVKAGFARLLEDASCTTTIPEFSHTFLEYYHPLGFDYPESVNLSGGGIIFIGDNLRICSRALIRLMSWAMANDLDGEEHHQPEFLRITILESADKVKSNPLECGIFYEVCISNCVYMTGTFESWKDDFDARKELEQVFRFLSHVYGLPVYKNLVTYEQLAVKEKSYDTFEDILIDGLATNKDQVLEYRALQKTYRMFKKRELVTWNPDVIPYEREEVEGSVGQESYEIKDTELIPDYCSCGLGDDVSPFMHPKTRCNIRRRSWNGHHQLLTISIKGVDTKISGAYFDTASKFAY